MASVGSGESTVDAGDERRGGDFFEAVVRNSTDAVVSIDEDGTVVFANAAVERLCGFDPDELVGEPLDVLLPRSDADVVDRVTSSEREFEGENVEATVRHRDGREVPISAAFTEHRDGDDRIFTGVFRDVSRRVAREQRLERKTEQLEEFVDVVSHDLRNPLQLARGKLSVARERADADCDALAEVAEAHERMSRLVEELLTLAKQGRAIGETEPVDLGRVAREAWATAGDDACDLAVSTATVRADDERLRTLFENLFRNVRTHAGTATSVRVEPFDGESGFFVADDGVGLDADDCDRVFDRGYTSTDSEVGFGLSIVRAIAQAHGWEVRATESDAGGARFEFSDVAVVDEEG
ncbi:PAS domain-containing sensor histidine kinase [Salinirarus marinus]|uniref:PAS domain-containing sensor histidine kinase n=1 Tax=Salinirarus marinus TaxID=3068310 RepID=UPI003C6C9CFD